MIHVPTAPEAHVVFDVVAWASAAALGAWLSRWRLRGTVERLAHQAGPGYSAAVVAGALPGAFLAGSFNTLREAAATISHSVVGALAGAIVSVEIYKLWRGIRVSTGAMFVGPFAMGVFVGRWGCLFAGLPDDTYGTPTNLKWGVELGDGISRHPVQIYESLSMLLFLGVYLIALRQRAPWALHRAFYALVAWYGIQRFGWEFLKPYPGVLGPFNVFHLICAGLVIYGCAYFVRDLRRTPVPCAA